MKQGKKIPVAQETSSLGAFLVPPSSVVVRRSRYWVFVVVAAVLWFVVPGIDAS